LAISKEKKKDMVADYVEKLSSSQAVILTNYRGLNVAHLTELRRKLREEKSTYQIIKNTLFKLALQEAGIPIPVDELEGTVAVSYCSEEVPPVARMLTAFATETGILQIRGAILGTDLLGAEEVKSLADLPPREILLGQLLASVQSPMSSMVSTINAPLRELVQVLQARAEQDREAAA
jgi:large subunit ribosomal protein L10